MKVFHLISGGDSGGAKTHVFSLLDKLKYLAYVRVGCLMEGVFYREILEKDIDSVLFKQKNRFDLSVAGEIAKMINDEGFDVLHVHGARANFVAMFLRKKVNVPIITTMHSDYMLDFDEPVKKLFFTNLNKAALRKIPYFIAVSDNFKDMLIERGFRPNAIYTVYNGMDFSKVPKAAKAKERYAIERGFCYEKDRIYVGIAARFDAVKGVDVFIRAAGEVLKKRHDVVFLIAGDGAEKDKLHALAREVGGGENIKFLGFENDIYGFLNIIDINCLTSQNESFPYSMLEGAAMGKMMVASRVGGIPSLVRDYETGFLFESGNYREMANKLVEAADNEALRLEMGANIKKRATTLFSSDNFASEHMKIYKSVLADYKNRKKYDFLISGYYGFNNNGDDALLAAVVQDIKKTCENARIAILSHRPKETKKKYRTDAVSRVNPFAIGRTMKKSKVLISGGGSLLQDKTSSKSLWYYLLIIRAAKMCGMKVMQLANGFGPVNKEFNVKLTRKTINNCVDVITLRDNDSYAKMEEIGIIVPKSVTADPAVMLDGIDSAARLRLFKAEGIPEGDYITVSVREWRDSAPLFWESVAAALKSAAERHGLNIVFITMQRPNDEAITRKAAEAVGERAFVIKKELSIEETIGVIAGARLNFAMRLHAMIYSAAKGVRTVALKYDPKIEGFMKYVGIENIADVKDADEEMLSRAIEKALSEDAPMPDAALREKAHENTLRALELLQ
ncbi:MAG: polysaccharide pyruvyl transferase CsaB [Clostridia bacterium]|nr:polysaccharide pyruvyl transferase CsaB [Clostridia bacterium]